MASCFAAQITLLVFWLPHSNAVTCDFHAHTQVLDATHGVNLSWTVRPETLELDVCVAAPMLAGGWLGTGWNAREAASIKIPGYLMEGGDFVLGYFLPNGSPCVRVASMGKPPWEGHLQPHWWGPNGAACITLTNTAFQEENGVTSLSFTRPFAAHGGKENCLKNNNSIQLARPQRQLYAGATSTQVPTTCTTELAPASLHAFEHKHNLFHGTSMIMYSQTSDVVV